MSNVFYVVAQKDDKLVELFFCQHPSSVAEVSAYAVRQLALVIANVDPWKLEVCKVKDGITRPVETTVYEVRWQGKPDNMILDSRRLEYRRRRGGKWELFA